MDRSLIAGDEQVRPIPLHAHRGISLVRGEGAYVWDSGGRRYLDLVTGYGVNILGHAHPAVTAAVCEQAKLLLNVHQSFESPARDDFLRALGALLPPQLSRVAFGNSGAEAIEAALKFARIATGRPTFVAMHRGYHGRSFGALAITGERKYREPFSPMLEPVRHVPYDDVDALRSAVDSTVAAVVVEPVQGEAGVRSPQPGYLRAVRELCDDQGALLVVDEIQTAFRTGPAFAFTRDGIVPDMLCAGKGLANGVPLSVTVTTETVAERIPRGSHGSTFAGSPLACAAGAATLTVLSDAALLSRIDVLGGYFLEKLASLKRASVREVRGSGLMLALELKHPATPAIKQLQEQSVLTLPAGSTTVRFLPPVNIEREQIDDAVSAVEHVLR